MPTKIVTVGKIDTVVTTRYEPLPNGKFNEHITIATPSVTDTGKFRLSLVKDWEKDRVWASR